MNQANARIEIQPNLTIAHVSKLMTGACIEDVNHELYGGIYSQMVFGESFAEPAPEPSKDFPGSVSGQWRGSSQGEVRGRFELEKSDLLNSPQAQRIVFESGTGELGVSNEGLNRWGMCFKKGEIYEGVLWAKADKPTELWVSLESVDGKARYADQMLQLAAGKWTRLSFQLKPSNPDSHGRMQVSLRKPGNVLLGYASLEPGRWGRFKGLHVRKDVGDALVAQGLTVLRLGGCMVNSPNYRWKEMIGPRDRRKPYAGFWYPQSSNGWGIMEFLRFCEAAEFVAIPALNMGETPQDVADFVEYVNGPATSTWGAKRTANGHAQPFKLNALQLGNEEQLNDDYWAKFEPMAKAVWAKDPKIVVVVGDFAYHDEIVDPWNFTGGAGCKSLAIQKKILDLAKAHGRTVWFDLHVGNDDPRQIDEPSGAYNGLRSYIAAMKKIADGADFKVVVFEENAGNHQLRRGLGHARMINALERIGDDVPVVCAANCLQPDKQNDNGWDQGLLFLSPTGVWGQSSYYVTQMVSKHHLPLCVEAKVTGAEKALDVTAKRSENGRFLQVQVVNMGEEPVVATVDFGGWKPTVGVFEESCIAGAWDDVNTEKEPRKIVPQSVKRALSKDAKSMEHTFPPRSFTILRFQ
jgi:alpha-L-arabinofuranosidase